MRIADFITDRVTFRISLKVRLFLLRCTSRQTHRSERERHSLDTCCAIVFGQPLDCCLLPATSNKICHAVCSNPRTFERTRVPIIIPASTLNWTRFLSSSPGADLPNVVRAWYTTREIQHALIDNSVWKALPRTERDFYLCDISLGESMNRNVSARDNCARFDS